VTHDETARRSRWYPSRLLDVYATVLVWFRWFVVAFWLLVTAAAVIYLPALGQGDSDLEKLVSADNPAIRSEIESFDKFGFPLLSRVAVVQRDAKGLPAGTHAKALLRAKEASEGKYQDIKPIVAAVPVTNAVGLIPGSTETGTTVITLLFTEPDVGFADQVEAAQRFVEKHYDESDSVVGITGSVPARVEQGDIVLKSLPWLEIATVIAVFLIVAVAFRSLVAPILALGVAGVAIMLTLHVGGYLAERMGVPVPQETQPLMVALLLGVVTDYVVFYLAGVRSEMAGGSGRVMATEWATAKFTPIIVTAGVTAAAGTGALIVAGSPTFRAFGPGMALAVLIGMVVAVTLAPALIAIFAPVALWTPKRFERRKVQREEEARGWWARILTQPVVAILVLLAVVGGLLLATLPVKDMKLGLSFVEALPAGHPARQAAEHAESGFAAGILSPTELLLQAPDLTGKQPQLKQLQEALAKEPGVAVVLGSGNDAVPQALRLFQAEDGSAVRYLIVLKDQPLGATAIGTLSRLEERLPALLRDAGLGGVRTSFGGDTAVADVVVDQTTMDLARIAIAAILANLLFLMIFLRAVVAPVGLLVCSVLAIGATLGVTTWLFQTRLGADGLTFYVPFAAAVLLVALGSDYNIFGVGPAWKEARDRPLREALAITLPQSARAIRTAAFTLAVSFGLLALIPLRPFRELAFALSFGILIDAFIVRSLLAPALLTVLGRASEWPGRNLFRRAIHPRQPREEEVPSPSAPGSRG
jgi:RND superfamily putative drug exporter